MHRLGAAAPSLHVLGPAHLGFISSLVHTMSLSSEVPCGDSAITTRLGAVSMWLHMVTSRGQSRREGAGFKDQKGYLGKVLILP